VVTAQRLLATSARTAAAAGDATRVQLAAQALLAEARVHALPLGLVTGTSPDGIAFEREVRAADHPALREVRVRAHVDATAGASCELVEVLRAATAP
jgi:hypothetical protein